jgi:hypothetical protein
MRIKKILEVPHEFFDSEAFNEMNQDRFNGRLIYCIHDNHVGIYVPFSLSTQDQDDAIMLIEQAYSRAM